MLRMNIQALNKIINIATDLCNCADLNQCIIATKDFIDHGQLKMEALNGIDGTVYRIQKAEEFDQEDLATIRTVITKIK